jgi:hypothetical protein
MNQSPSMVEGARMYEWQKYVFDIKVIDKENIPVPQINLYNSLKQQNISTHELVHGSSIGRASTVGPGVSAYAISGLWQEQTMKRPRGALHIKIYMSKEFADIDGELSPDSYKISAQYVCYTWAKRMSQTSLPNLLAEVLKKEEDNWTKDLPLNIPLWDFSLWDLKTDQWEGDSPVSLKVPIQPYIVGKYLVVPVEVHIEKADFESNCL